MTREVRSHVIAQRLVDTNGILDWSFRSVFDRTIPRACPVANSSEIHVELPSNMGTGFSLTPEPLSVASKIATYDVTPGKLISSAVVFDNDYDIVLFRYQTPRNLMWP